MTIFDRTDHNDEPQPPPLTALEATVARQQRMIGQLIDRLIEKDQADHTALAVLSQQVVELRQDVERLKVAVYRWRKAG